MLPFFETFIANLPEELKEPFARIKDLFWHQLNDLLQMKAVLVNTKTKAALITRLDVTTSLESKGLDRLEFENTVDDRMYHSCWNAVQAARGFLEDQFPDILKDKVLQIPCRFPNPIAGYNDTSASLLVSLKVIGDVLDMEIDPQTVVSGEVDESGKILPVTCITEKIAAAEQETDLRRLILPADGIFADSHRIAIIRVRTFADALMQYYGEQFRKKMKQNTRRIIVPRVVSTFKNLFLTSANPVTEYDVRLIDHAKNLCQKEGKYQIAIDILETVITRFQREDSATEALWLKAQALGYLGVIYTEQRHLEKSLQALQQALSIWQAIRDREECVNTLLRIGSLYRYALIADKITPRWQISLKFYQQAHELLRPSMKQFTRLQAKYYRLLGYLDYLSEDYILAEQHCRKSMEYFDEDEANTRENYYEWNYQTAKQHLGRVLMKQGAYDRAYAVLESTINASILQTPHNQARSFWTLSEFFFSVANIEKGGEFAKKAEQLCRDFGLTAEHQILTNLLARYRLSS